MACKVRRALTSSCPNCRSRNHISASPPIYALTPEEPFPYDNNHAQSKVLHKDSMTHFCILFNITPAHLLALQGHKHDMLPELAPSHKLSWLALLSQVSTWLHGVPPALETTCRQSNAKKAAALELNCRGKSTHVSHIWVKPDTHF
jgi:hypothetical protein